MKIRNRALVMGIFAALMGGQMAFAQATVAPGARAGGSGRSGGGGGSSVSGAARTGGSGGGRVSGSGTGGFSTSAAPTIETQDGETTAVPTVIPTGRGGITTVRIDRPVMPLMPPSPDDGPTCAFDATIYALKLPADQIARIEIDEMNKAAGKTDDFEKALAQFGKSKPLYRAMQSVTLGGDSILISARTPYVTNVNRISGGIGGGMGGGGMGMGGGGMGMGGGGMGMGGGERTVNSVGFSTVGAAFSLSGSAMNKSVINLKMSIQLSVTADSNATLSDDVKAQLFRSATLVQNGQVEANKPFVIMSMDAASADADGNATAYIARVTLGEPKK